MSSLPNFHFQFDNAFVRELPPDAEVRNYRRQVLGACYSKVLPTRVSAPQLVAYADEVAQLLDFSPDFCRSGLFTEVFAGNQLLEGMEPYASNYGGHQFGHWAGQLGDGRAINLGDVINRQGQRWALQLKGAGPTPYSRNADGLAVLRSSVREFLCSEAMHHLGVPTTRALSVILTGETVIRDMFYNGNPQAEPGAVVCRVGPSFTRFGHFQLLAARDEMGLLKKLVDYTLQIDFPHLGPPSRETYAQWFDEVCIRTAKLLVEWQRVGFVHGVMNTDNMSILGLTIDYGPYGWLENFDPDWTPNTTDAQEHRYAYGKQPSIAYWNLGQLANALFPLLRREEPLHEAMAHFVSHFEQGWNAMMAQKLGLQESDALAVVELIQELLKLLVLVETDMTIFYRRLADFDQDTDLNDQTWRELVLPAYYVPDQLSADYWSRLEQWFRRYQSLLQTSATPQSARKASMNTVNPKYVLRNYLAQLAIDKAEKQDFSMVQELLQVLRQPYAEQPEYERYAEKRPEWARHRAGCSMLSCSS